ncbi:MAG: hypothetical protein L3J08_01985 [Flavobacteriaceae bacterium]|nr:hypothetical protein [Flavobacteriaceae bacterium]
MKKIITLLVLSLLFIQCNKKEDYKIEKNKIGEINKSTKIGELDDIFKNDSIVKLPLGSDKFKKYKIYNKEGKHLLTIKPPAFGDTINAIESVQIYDQKYLTEKKISTASLFKDIVANYTINKIEPTFTSAMLFIDEINITIALDKRDLKLDEFDMRKISQGQIPDNAKIKFITVWFE